MEKLIFHFKGIENMKKANSWYIKDYEKKLAIAEGFRMKVFIGYFNGKKHFSIGRGSIYFSQRAPRGEVWSYE